uniref:Protein FAM195A n=1 Tax=Isometrus maculatus TaxID=497827 RepID=A0A0U1U036_ISOMC|nr:hypothetical protein [Isometrus maculatus]
MYAYPKGPSRIGPRTRREVNTKQDYDNNYECRKDIHAKRYRDVEVPQSTDMRRINMKDNLDPKSSPKFVYPSINGRRFPMQRNLQEVILSHHEEVIKFIYSTWKNVYKEYELTKQSPAEGKVPNVVFYQDKSTENNLHDFKRFDLESFYEQRFSPTNSQSA